MSKERLLERLALRTPSVVPMDHVCSPESPWIVSEPYYGCGVCGHIHECGLSVCKEQLSLDNTMQCLKTGLLLKHPHSGFGMSVSNENGSSKESSHVPVQTQAESMTITDMIPMFIQPSVYVDAHSQQRLNDVRMHFDRLAQQPPKAPRKSTRSNISTTGPVCTSTPTPAFDLHVDIPPNVPSRRSLTHTQQRLHSQRRLFGFHSNNDDCMETRSAPPTVPAFPKQLEEIRDLLLYILQRLQVPIAEQKSYKDIVLSCVWTSWRCMEDTARFRTESREYMLLNHILILLYTEDGGGRYKLTLPSPDELSYRLADYSASAYHEDRATYEQCKPYFAFIEMSNNYVALHDTTYEFTEEQASA
jgi:hypothetical protein